MPISRRSFSQGPTHPPKNFIWFHIVLTMYGAWLPGNSRGFRTRHHRRHVEGDYKSPPSKDHTRLLAKSALLTKHSAARLSLDYREVLGIAVIERVQQLGGFVLTTAVMGSHVHILAKLPSDKADSWVGLAKKHAWFEMRNAGWQGKLWAKKAKIERIRGKSHHRNCFWYIVNHYHQGGWVWIWEGVADPMVERVINGR